MTQDNNRVFYLKKSDVEDFQDRCLIAIFLEEYKNISLIQYVKKQHFVGLYNNSNDKTAHNFYLFKKPDDIIEQDDIIFVRKIPSKKTNLHYELFKKKFINSYREYKNNAYTYDERLLLAPREGWQGDYGESLCRPNINIPEGKAAADKLSEYKLKGIEYNNGLPDFSHCAQSEVKIDMTGHRESTNGVVGNYMKADTVCAKQWSDEKRFGKDNWSAADIKNWRRENKYSWHEDADKTTCYLVPREIHDYFKHIGGVAECKRRDGEVMRGNYDD